jgi:hypothetical protein
LSFLSGTLYEVRGKAAWKNLAKTITKEKSRKNHITKEKACKKTVQRYVFL